MGDDGGKPENEGDKKVVHVYPLVKVKGYNCYINGYPHQVISLSTPI